MFGPLLRREWKSFGGEFASNLLRRLLLGGVISACGAIALHFITIDNSVSLTKRKEGAAATLYKASDSLRAYRRELITLNAVLLLALFLFVASRIMRFIRAWWAGIISFVVILTAVAIMAALESSGDLYLVACFLTLIATVVLESWRQRAKPHRVYAGKTPQEVLSLPSQKASFNLNMESWKALPSDDPIRDWNEDIIGRTAVVELLAEHVFLLGTPVIALHGALGDGKSSVLNLLRNAMESKAIVVSFNAWLPGGETTFAIDLFRDIATECRKWIYVPQLRKRALVYARTISGSIPYFAGLKEMLPAESQRDEIEELRRALTRIPRPIVVLLDEMDRMQKEELLVVLKILRGIASIPNISFICAFSEADLRSRLAKDDTLSYDYLEKFFPVTISLGAPDPELLGRLFQSKLTTALKQRGYLREQAEKTDFTKLLDHAWEASLSGLCTNFRKAGLLLNDIVSAARPIAGEVNAFDLTAIESLRRFYPDVYRMVRKNSVFLTYESRSWGKKAYVFAEDEKKRDSQKFLKELEVEISKCEEPSAARVLLDLLFPEFEAANKTRAHAYSFIRTASAASADSEKRICDPDYFQVYFRAAVPEEMFSNAELEQVISELNRARSQSEIDATFSRVLSNIPKQHPKRADFLWKLGRSMSRLSDDVAEQLAYAAALRADEYAYDVVNIGEAARGLNIVFEAAQKLSTTSKVQEVLTKSMLRAPDDTFARRIWEYTRDKDRNKVLVNFSNVDVAEIKNAFIQRMRNRYGASAPIETIDIAHGDWWAFRSWGDNSEQDRDMVQSFWRRYIGLSREHLTQAINVVYPPGTTWEQDPAKVISSFFPVEEVKQLLESLPEDAQLDSVEVEAINRFRSLLEGKWFDIRKMEH